MRNAIAFLCCVLATPVAPSATQPNVVVVLADDLGYADVGFNGCEDIPTPNLDALARDGAVFTDAYVTFPVCSPSRAGLITGRHQQRFGYERNPIYNPQDDKVGLPLTERTLADTLGAAGYVSGVYGKWHLGAHDNFHPLNRGFDEFYGFLTGGHQYFPEMLTLRGTGFHFSGYREMMMRQREFVEETEYLTTALSREAADFVRRHADEPFFLYLSYNAPHTPMQAPAEVIERFSSIENKKRRTYAAMVSVMDTGIGRVLQEIDRQGIAGRTIVFFLSDNGGAPSNASRNTPLRGHKGNVYDGGLRVPFAMRWTGVVPAGQRRNEPISSLDIYATAVAQAGAAAHVSPERPIDGVDLLPHLTGAAPDPPHDYLFFRSTLTGGEAVRSGNLKLVRPAAGETLAAYDLAADIAESNDVAAERASEAEKLRRRWDAWNAELIAPIFVGLESIEEYRKAWGR